MGTIEIPLRFTSQTECISVNKTVKALKSYGGFQDHKKQVLDWLREKRFGRKDDSTTAINRN